MREIRPSGSEGGVALTTPSLPLSPTTRECATAGPFHPLPEFLALAYVAYRVNWRHISRNPTKCCNQLCGRR
jgi:hypothetical protein